ncbi:MAG TPA: hypothetical protein VG406_29010 [Isosphaeraceae bacterium]|jgi:hypothetical protein|nr:hypothetical protein [Isosphaeraceae bacterium]
MTAIASAIVALTALGQGIEPEHAANPIYRALRAQGVKLDGIAVTFPAPLFVDGQDAAAERKALRGVAGSAAKANELLRDSVTAPMVLKVRDIRGDGDSGTIVRAADLWFVVHADLATIDLDRLAGLSARAEPVEVGNMRFESKTLTADQVKAQGIEPMKAGDAAREWFVHVAAILLDRVQVEATDRVMATKSADSIVVASRTAPEFKPDGPFPTRWRKLFRNRDGKNTAPGPSQPYSGGAGYVKVSRSADKHGALLVEAHFVFDEPRAWFGGAPTLRSKIGLVAQDRIRRLRRELADRAAQGK